MIILVTCNVCGGNGVVWGEEDGHIGVHVCRDCGGKGVIYIDDHNPPESPKKEDGK